MRVKIKYSKHDSVNFSQAVCDVIESDSPDQIRNLEYTVQKLADFTGRLIECLVDSKKLTKEELSFIFPTHAYELVD